MPNPQPPTTYDPATADAARIYRLQLIGGEEITIAPGIPLTAITCSGETTVTRANAINGTLAIGDEAAIADSHGIVSGLIVQLTTEPLNALLPDGWEAWGAVSNSMLHDASWLLSTVTGTTYRTAPRSERLFTITRSPADPDDATRIDGMAFHARAHKPLLVGADGTFVLVTSAGPRTLRTSPITAIKKVPPAS